MVAGWRAGPFRTADGTLDILARAGAHLSFRVLLVGETNPGFDRPPRDFAGRRIPAGRGSINWACTLLVRADAAVVFHRIARADSVVLRGDHRIAAGGAECIASCDFTDLLTMLSLVCERGRRIFRISVGWNAAGGRIHFSISCTRGFPARIGATPAAHACRRVPFVVGVVSHLLRIWRRQTRQRRSAMAEFHSDGRVLPERPAADMDWLVRPASSALVSRRDRIQHPRARAGHRVDLVFATPVANCVLLHRHAL